MHVIELNDYYDGTNYLPKENNTFETHSNKDN